MCITVREAITSLKQTSRMKMYKNITRSRLCNRVAKDSIEISRGRGKTVAIFNTRNFA